MWPCDSSHLPKFVWQAVTPRLKIVLLVKQINNATTLTENRKEMNELLDGKGRRNATESP
jgi:hypothetical protein